VAHSKRKIFHEARKIAILARRAMSSRPDEGFVQNWDGNAFHTVGHSGRGMYGLEDLLVSDI